MTTEEKAARKAELLAKLKVLGVTETSGTEAQAPLTGKESNLDLVKILRAVEKAAGEAEEPEDGEDDGIDGAAENDEITIYTPGTVLFGAKAGTRTFTRAQHGNDFLKAAEEYRVKFAGTVVKDVEAK